MKNNIWEPEPKQKPIKLQFQVDLASEIGQELKRLVDKSSLPYHVAARVLMARGLDG